MRFEVLGYEDEDEAPEWTNLEDALHYYGLVLEPKEAFNVAGLEVWMRMHAVTGVSYNGLSMRDAWEVTIEGKFGKFTGATLAQALGKAFKEGGPA